MLSSEQKYEIIKELVSRDKAANSLYEFVKQAWHVVEGDNKYTDGWHIQAICEHLEACSRREIRNLLINLPPRCMKSLLISVFFPCWLWINHPEEQFLFASYALSLSVRDSVKCRRLLQSNWFQIRYGSKFKIVSDNNTKIKFENDKHGYRIASSVGGTVTGEGGSILCVDDGNNSLEGESEVKRENALEWWASTWSTRLNNKNTGIRICLQQRLHMRDLSGNIIANDNTNEWTKLILPMEFSESRRSKTIILPSTKGKIWEDPRKKDGELLWPERFDEKGLQQLKNDLGSEYRVAGQLNQLPAPESGGIIKKSWFSWWKKPLPPKLEYIIQSWDTALTVKKDSCYSAMTCWGVFKDERKVNNVILLSMWRGKVEYPELRERAKKLYQDYRDTGENPDLITDFSHSPDIVLCEAQMNGQSLIQDLTRAGVPAIGFNPAKYGDKIQRVRLISHILEAGLCWMPATPPNYTRLRPFADMVVEECAVFPNSDDRDLVDTLSQSIIRLRDSGWLSHKDDEDRTDTNFTTPDHAFY